MSYTEYVKDLVRLCKPSKKKGIWRPSKLSGRQQAGLRKRLLLNGLPWPKDIIKAPNYLTQKDIDKMKDPLNTRFKGTAWEKAKPAR
jgi:hypothetical protein